MSKHQYFGNLYTYELTVIELCSEKCLTNHIFCVKQLLVSTMLTLPLIFYALVRTCSSSIDFVSFKDKIHPNWGENYISDTNSYNDGVTFTFDDDDPYYYYYSDFNPFNVRAVSTGAFLVNETYVNVKSLAVFDNIVIIGGITNDARLISIMKYNGSSAVHMQDIIIPATTNGEAPIVSTDGNRLVIGIFGMLMSRYIHD